MSGQKEGNAGLSTPVFGPAELDLSLRVYKKQANL
jgi:hypothetical protein